MSPWGYIALGLFILLVLHLTVWIRETSEHKQDENRYKLRPVSKRREQHLWIIDAEEPQVRLGATCSKAPPDLRRGRAAVMTKPVCIGCGKHPIALPEYLDLLRSDEDDDTVFDEEAIDQVVRDEEGTYNWENGHFLCTACYIAAGQPSSKYGWVAP